MIEVPGDFGQDVIGTLWPAFLVFLRLGAMAFVLPAFGERAVPVRVRLGAAMAFTLIVLPAIAAELPALPDAPGPALGAGAAEIAAGLFFGLLLRLFVMALQTAGTIAAQSTSISQIFGGGPGSEPQPAIANVLMVGGLALGAILGLHVHIAAYMIEGYRLIPPGVAPMPGTVAEVGLAEISRTFALAFTLAAPFVVASLVYNVTLGVINRAMPQLMVAFVGAPAITFAGLALLLLAGPLILEVWMTAFQSFLGNPAG